MQLTPRSMHSSRGMLVKRLSTSNETMNLPNIDKDWVSCTRVEVYILSQVIIVKCSNRRHDGAKWRSGVGSTSLSHFGEAINSCWLGSFGIDILVLNVIKTAILLHFSEEMLRTGAQLVEDRAVVREVVSSTPTEPTLRVLTL